MFNIFSPQGNSNQKYFEIAFHICHNAKDEQHNKQISIVTIWGKGDTITLLGEVQTPIAII